MLAVGVECAFQTSLGIVDGLGYGMHVGAPARITLERCSVSVAFSFTLSHCIYVSVLAEICEFQ